MIGCIYAVSMRDTGIVYVGQTRQKPEARWRQHARGRTRLSAMLRLFGPSEYFDYFVVEEVSVEQLDARERHWIEVHNTLAPNGLNFTIGGSNNAHRPDAIAKMAASMKAVCANPEYKAKVSEIRKQLWQDPNYREKVIRRAKEAKATPEHKAKLSHVKTEMWKSGQRKAEAQERAKQQWANPEKRRQMAEAISKAQKARLSDPVLREQHTERRLATRRRNQLTT